MSDRRRPTPSAFALPDAGWPELALMGRSNAGKSSLLNALVGRRQAPVSATPGKTQTVSFYPMRGWYLVDLPGYGYARTSKSRREAMGEMVEWYLTQRQPLLGGVVVQDCRRDPEAEEYQLLEWAATRNLWLVVVANKVDKLNQAERRAREAALATAWGRPVLMLSAKTRENLEALKTAIRGLGLAL
ncbi:MAG: ribosome biogenesis GTP-binding protein YihA/YsxC [Firmicutes bacterium]|nr:ribosome biogenesis GTP-binding protein YsxC [Alicyclobacillaceae bacterium]MCL6496994.1 ribosome biogenesis GTP-binding protein YihA/YsxC [Bacillota bacterium]